MIKEFRGEYYFLSNFYNAKVFWDGITYDNNEAAFQSAKTTDKTVRDFMFAGVDAPTAKKTGRKIQLRPDWEEVKFDVMYEIVKAKFTQNPYLKAKLLETGNEELQEGNCWHDNTYGNCLCYKCRNITGKNILGEILMKVRSELKDVCDYCNEEDIKNSDIHDFAGCDGIYYSEKDDKYYLVIEHCKNEINRIEIKNCPKCGRKLGSIDGE
jgi:ribA/ribD-fused uncharacterized protein